MLNVEGINLEYPQIGKEPSIGYTPEYEEKVMISGLIRRKYKGKRFYAEFTYDFLQQSEIGQIKDLINSQSNKGYLNVEISSPFGAYTGKAFIELNNNQKRFKWDDELQDYVWTNWQLTIKGADYAN